MCKFKRCDKYLFKDNILLSILFQIKRPCYLRKKKHQTYGKCNKISHVQMFPVCFTAPRNHFQNALHRSPTGHGGRELKQNRACMWIPCKFTPTSWFHIIKLQFTHVWNHTSVQSKPSEM